jgi:hypothetical protein
MAGAVGTDLDGVVLRVRQGEGADEDAEGHGRYLGQIRRGGDVVERGAHAAGVAVPPVPHDELGAGQRGERVLPVEARLIKLQSRSRLSGGEACQPSGRSLRHNVRNDCIVKCK